MLYRVVIEQAEDAVFMAECPTLLGCSSPGATRAEAVSNDRDPIKGYLESLAQHNEPIPPSIDKETVEVNL